MRNTKKILIIIQRSNGDVFLSSSLIKSLYEHFDNPQIDMLVNDDTFAIASLMPFIKNIYTFSYQLKEKNRWKQEKNIILKIFNKYDLSINLTASDRSIFYGFLAAKISISAVESDRKKSWWKKMLLTHYYYFDNSQHILINNLYPLNFLNINAIKLLHTVKASSKAVKNIKKKLAALNITDFLVFHASTQYQYKIYPQHLREILLSKLSKLGVFIIITGGKNSIDLEIKKHLMPLTNVIDFIGETSLEEFVALSQLSQGYIGMDTLNMHIAAAQNKRIFAIFGPTNLRMWSPWSNQLRLSATENKPVQTYGNVTIFQADMPCVACGNAGCDNNHGVSECLNKINPKLIFKEIENWYQAGKIN